MQYPLITFQRKRKESRRKNTKSSLRDFRELLPCTIWNFSMETILKLSEVAEVTLAKWAWELQVLPTKKTALHALG